MNEVDEKFRFYRQSSLGFSATIITLSCIMAKVILEKISFPLKYSCSTFLWATLIFGSIIAAVSIQFCYHMGYKNMANRYFPPKGSDKDTWFREKTNFGNKWFRGQDILVWVSGVSCLIGFFCTSFLWKFLK